MNAYTTTTAQFTMPAVSSNVSVSVVVSTWASVGQVVFVKNAGYFTVNSIPDSTHLSLNNLGYSGNAAPATVIATSQTVSPGGLIGATGASGANTLNDISPTTTKGDLIVDNGANNPNASDVRLAAGANKLVLHADSALALGVGYKAIDLTGTLTSITGVLPIADGGTGQVRPAAVQGSATNLVVATIPASTFVVRTKLAVSARQIVLMDASSNAFCVHGLAVNMDINPGVNPIGTPGGLDTGLYPVASVWMYVWAIYNGSSASAVFSTSSTAPTLSSGSLSGYTYTAFMGAIYFDTTIPGFIRSIQYGNQVNIQETVVFNDQAGSVAFTQTNISTIIPPIAAGYSGTVGASSESAAPWGMVITSDSDGLVGAFTYNASDATGTKLNGFFHCAPFSLLISSSPKQMNWKTSNTDAQYRVTISGYTL